MNAPYMNLPGMVDHLLVKGVFRKICNVPDINLWSFVKDNRSWRSFEKKIHFK